MEKKDAITELQIVFDGNLGAVRHSQYQGGTRHMTPNQALQPTVLPPLRSGKPAAELYRYASYIGAT